MPERRAMGALETEVLSVLWANPDGGTPGEVLESLDSDLAYTTVMTIMTRLWKKGLVERARDGRAYRYRPVTSEAELAAARMQAALAPVSDREATLSRFVEGLSRKDERVLRQLVAELDSRR